MRRALLLVLAGLCPASARAAVICRVPTTPVPALRQALAAPSASPLSSPALLSAPLAAPALTPSLILPQAPSVQTPLPTAAVETGLVPPDASEPQAPAVGKSDRPAPAGLPLPPAGVSLDRLISFASSLARLASRDPRPALDSFWAGPQAHSDAVAAQGPSYLDTPRDADFIQLGAIVAAARSSPSGRKVIRAVQTLTKKEGRPIQVRFQNLKGNLGEYDYIGRILYLNGSYRDGDPNLAAATLVHEMVHILQHAEGVPAEALEMELEAHVITLKVLDELGVPPGRDGSFAAAAARELRKSPEAFEAWMARQLPGKLRLNKGLAAAVAELEDERDELAYSIANLEEAYEESGSAQAKGRLEKALQGMAAVKSDLKALKSSSGRAAYGRLAARAHALMASYHRALVRRR